MQIKTTTRDHSTQGMAIIKKSTNNKCSERVEKGGPSYSVSWHSHYGEQYENSSKSVICSVVSSSLQPHGLSPVHGILQARILEWVSHSFLQGIFPTQGSKPCLLHGR